MSKASELHAAILMVLDEEHRIEQYRIVSDTEIAERLEAQLDDVRRQLDILEAEDYTESANSSDGHRAWIAPKGMALADEIREASEADEQPSKPPIGFT